jgi:hypothetical protein
MVNDLALVVPKFICNLSFRQKKAKIRLKVYANKSFVGEVPLFASLKKGLPISTTTMTVLFVSWVSHLIRRCHVRNFQKKSRTKSRDGLTQRPQASARLPQAV